MKKSDGKFRKEIERVYRETITQKREQEIERRRRASVETLEAFQKAFGYTPDEVMENIVLVDDIRIAHGYVPNEWSDDREYWAVLNKCPRCGEIVHSPDCYTFEEISEMACNFRPDYTHVCRRRNIFTRFGGWIQSLARNVQPSPDFVELGGIVCDEPESGVEVGK
jgi:hypothetical protein